MQLGQGFGIVLRRRRQKLEGHGIAELQIFGAIHLAHAAASQERNNAVTPGKDRSRRKCVAQ